MRSRCSACYRSAKKTQRQSKAPLPLVWVSPIGRQAHTAQSPSNNYDNKRIAEADRRATSRDPHIDGQVPITSSSDITRVYPTGAPDYGRGHLRKWTQPADWTQAPLPRVSHSCKSAQGNKAPQRWQAPWQEPWFQDEGKKIGSYNMLSHLQNKQKLEGKGHGKGRRLFSAHPARGSESAGVAGEDGMFDFLPYFVYVFSTSKYMKIFEESSPRANFETQISELPTGCTVSLFTIMYMK